MASASIPMDHTNVDANPASSCLLMELDVKMLMNAILEGKCASEGNVNG